MPTRCANLGRFLIAGLLVCAPATSDAADSRQLRQRGKVVLQENCGRCHAIEAAGESPLKEAPPMRDIYARFSPREFAGRAVGGHGFQAQGDVEANRPSRDGVFYMPNIDTN